MAIQQRRRRDQTPFDAALAGTGVVPPPLSARSQVTDEEVARRAYELYEQRGGEDGRAWDDWFQAERELRGRLRED